MSNELFGFVKKDYVEVHIFVNDDDFEVIDCPLEFYTSDNSNWKQRVFYWKKLGFGNVYAKATRLITKCVEV